MAGGSSSVTTIVTPAARSSYEPGRPGDTRRRSGRRRGRRARCRRHPGCAPGGRVGRGAFAQLLGLDRPRTRPLPRPRSALLPRRPPTASSHHRPTSSGRSCRARARTGPDRLLGDQLPRRRIRACSRAASAHSQRRTIRDLVRRDIERARNFSAAQNHDVLPEGEPLASPCPRSPRPTLVVHGTADPMSPIGHGQALAEEIPGARLLRPEGAGHGIDRADWDRIIPAMLATAPEAATSG